MTLFQQGPMDPSHELAFRTFYLLGWSAPLISCFVVFAIFGISVAQVIYYHTHYVEDSLNRKAVVAVVFLLDGSSLALILFSMHQAVIASWGPPIGVESRVFPAEFGISTVVVFLVQCFYIRCIHALRCPHWIILVLVTLSLGALATGLTLVPLYVPMGIDILRAGSIEFSTMLYASRSIALACDIGIVIALCFLVRWHHAKARGFVDESMSSIGTSRGNGTSRSAAIVKAILLLTIERGVLLTMVQAGELVGYTFRPCLMFLMPFHFIATRVYCTSLFATLNCRTYISQIGTANYQDYPISTVVFTSNIRSPQSPEMAAVASHQPPHFAVGGAEAHTSNSNSYGGPTAGISFVAAPRSVQFRSSHEDTNSMDKFVSPLVDGSELRVQ